MNKFNLTILKCPWKYRNVPENAQMSLKMIMSVPDSIIPGLAPYEYKDAILPVKEIPLWR